jgi:hypothetical protein
MPIEAKPVERQEADRPGQRRCEEEMLVVDARSQMCPAQMVENKLRGLLKSGSLPVSNVQLGSVGEGRRHC